MCVTTNAHHISFEKEELKATDDPNAPSFSAKVQGLRFGDLLRHGRVIAITVLMAAYLGHQANESKSFTNLNWSWFGKANEEEPSIKSWWIVAYALIAYTMFGSRRWLVHRSFRRITTATSTAFQQVASSEALTKIRSTVSMKSIQLFGTCHDDEHCGKRTLTLSTEPPFVSESHVASMTLGDVTDVFRYAFQCDNTDFHAETFAKEVREPARKAIERLSEALWQSRGERVQPRTCDKCSEFGSLDVLAFVGACRIFAEWMPIRLVPEGFGRYAFGLGVARRDMLGNVAKVEKAVHAYLDKMVQDADGGTIDSPSIRDILDYEIKTKKHHNLPKLSNNTAAQAILWLKRQLQYQTALFGNNSEVPYHFPDSKAAARAAYEHVYGAYHGFFVRQIFQNSFDAAPPTNMILHHMNLPKLNQLHEIDEVTLELDDDDEDMWIQLPVDRDSFQSSFRSLTVAPAPPLIQKNPFLDFIGKVVKEHVVKLGACLGMEGHAHPSLNALSPHRGSLASLGATTGPHMVDSNDNSPDKDIAAYLFALRPFLHGLDNLMEELNMNDPSRV